MSFSVPFEVIKVSLHTTASLKLWMIIKMKFLRYLERHFKMTPPYYLAQKFTLKPNHILSHLVLKTYFKYYFINFINIISKYLSLNFTNLGQFEWLNILASHVYIVLHKYLLAYAFYIKQKDNALKCNIRGLKLKGNRRGPQPKASTSDT